MPEEQEIPVMLPAATFRAVENLARQSLSYSSNHKAVRDALSALCLHLQQQSERMFGTASIDARLLSDLLKRTKPDYDVGSERVLQTDPLEDLLKSRHLDPVQLSAAKQIRRVWDSFGRFLIVSARNYERGGGRKRSKPLQPLDVMGSDVYELWRDHYTPWYKTASSTLISSVNGSRTFHEGTITLLVVVEFVQPRLVDELRGLGRGVTTKILQRQLRKFNGNT